MLKLGLWISCIVNLLVLTMTLAWADTSWTEPWCDASENDHEQYCAVTKTLSGGNVAFIMVVFKDSMAFGISGYGIANFAATNDEITARIDGSRVRVRVYFASSGQNSNFFFSPNELSPRDTYNLLSRGTSLRINGQGDKSVDVSLKGSGNALKQTIEAAKEYGIDMTAFGYDPGDTNAMSREPD